MKLRKSPLLLMILFLLFSCEKHPFDYRNKYLGNYEVSEDRSSWIMGDATVYSTDQYILRVEYWEDDGIAFVKASGDTIKCYLDKSGLMSQDAGDIHYFFSGSFNGKDYFELTYGYAGLGGGYTTTLKGQK